MTPLSHDDDGDHSRLSSTSLTEKALDGAQVLEENEFHRTVLSRLLRRLHRRFGAERAVAVFTNENRELTLKAAKNFDAAGAQQTPPVLSRTIVEDVVKRRTPVLIQNALDDPILRDHTSIMEQGLRSVMCVPLLAADEVLGVIYMDNLSESGQFTSEDLETLNLVASYTAASLHGASLVEAEPEDDEVDEGVVDKETARMAHNFKNVLTAIQTRLRLSQQSHEQLQEDLSKAHEAVEVGRERVMQIADHVDTRSAGNRSKMNLADVLRQALDAMRDRMQADETSYKLEIDIPDSAELHGSRTQLQEVFTNLLSNAMDAIGHQGKLTISLQPESQNWVATVGDTGSGIPEEHQDQLFEPFFTTKGREGMGLGLSMVRSVVEQHGGSVSVNSQPGDGTVVTVRLPRNTI